METNYLVADKLICLDCLFKVGIGQADKYIDAHPHGQRGFPIKKCQSELSPIKEDGHRLASDEQASLKKRVAEIGRPFRIQLETIENDVLLINGLFARYRIDIDTQVSADILEQMRRQVPGIVERRDAEIGAIKDRLRRINDYLEVMKPRMSRILERQKYWKNWETKNYLLIDHAHVNYERITTVTEDDVSQLYFCALCQRLVGIIQNPPYFVTPHSNCPNSNKQLTKLDLMTISKASQKYPGNPDLKRPFDLPRDGHPG